VAANITASESTSSTSYTNLTTAGPTLTNFPVPASGKVLITVTTGMQGSQGGSSCFMSFTGSGANSIAASDINALILGGNNLQRASASFVLTGLTAGNTTLTSQYKAAGGQCTFSNRSIWAIPLP
jgi:hypothetical protein